MYIPSRDIHTGIIYDRGCNWIILQQTATRTRSIYNIRYIIIVDYRYIYTYAFRVLHTLVVLFGVSLFSSEKLACGKGRRCKAVGGIFLLATLMRLVYTPFPFPAFCVDCFCEGGSGFEHHDIVSLVKKRQATFGSPHRLISLYYFLPWRVVVRRQYPR